MATLWTSRLPPALLISILSLVSGPALVSSADPAPGAPSDFAEQIQRYLTATPDEADGLLEQILKRSDADLATVESLITAGPEYAPQAPGRYPSVPVSVRGRHLSYALSVPSGYRPSVAAPLVICLHGAGFTGEAYLDRWESRLGGQYLLACPTLMAGTWWTRTAEELVLATLASVRGRYHIDPDRVFLTGMSNGGIGAYLIGVHHATVFGGLAPMASGLDHVLFPFLANLRHTPVYLIHGSRDTVMPVEMSRTMAKELARLGITYVYREHDRSHPMAGGHFFPREELPQLVAWLDAQRRPPVPKTLTVVRDASHLASFDWVRIDATDRIAAFSEKLIDSMDDMIRQRVYARVDAEVVGPNQIEVRTQRVRRYTLFLNDALVDLSKPVRIVTNGRVSYEAPVTPRVEMLLRDARMRQDPRRLFPVSVTIAVEGDQ